MEITISKREKGEKIQQMDGEIKKLRNIIKDHRKCQQMDEEIRKQKYYQSI